MADTENNDRRAEATQSESDAPIKLDMPDIERDKAGIPKFVFRDGLSESDKPTADKRTLEVVLLWREAVMSVGHYDTPRPITVGEAVKNDFRISSEGLSFDRFSLIDGDETGFYVNWTSGMAVEVKGEDGEIVDQDGLAKRQQLLAVSDDSEAAHRYHIGLHDRVAVQCGDLTFVIQYVSPARLIATSFWKTIDLYFTKVLSLSFLGHLFLLLALLLTPFDPNSLDDDLFKNPNRFAKLILKEQKKEKKKLELSGSKGGGKHKDKEGKFGKVKKKKKDALASTKGAPKVDPNKREKDRKIALQAGIFKALSGGPGGNVSNVFGPGGLGTGINNALGGLRGTDMGDAGGAGGLGTRGSGPGGGGNSLGIGGLGNGTGRGTGGLGSVDLGGRGKSRYAVIPGRTITKGCLTKQQVSRVINRIRNQVRYCYEKELPRNPNLSGKITTSFVVGPTGSVMQANTSENTMGDKNVEQCVLRQIQRLKFPPCAGGGTANITYPFIFKSGG